MSAAPAILRSHQVKLIERIDAVIAAGSRRIVAQAPTGFGKTIVAAHRLRALQDAGKRGLFIVPALSLIDQTIEKVFAEGVRDVGVIQASHSMTNYARPIQVASVQTLQRRPVPEADEIIIDEVHRWFGFYPKLVGEPRFANVPIIGLTATPWTKGLGKHFDTLLNVVTTRDLIDAGLLSPFRAFAPASPDLTNVRTLAGDFHERDLGEAMNKVTLIADVVTTWLDRAADRPTLCFAVDRAHAKHLQKQFLEAEVPAEYIDSYTDADERNAIAKRFHAGEVKVVCNVGCLTTGIDWDVRCIILARPTKSEILYVQMIGRGLRTAPGKADCLILDHSDNHTRLGFVTDIHHSELDQGEYIRASRSIAEEPLPKKCPKCSFLRPPKLLQCPCCGFVPVPRSAAIHRDGELVELGHRAAAEVERERAAFYRELRAVAQMRGYKDGWTAHKFKDKFGHFPSRDYSRLQPKAPSDATLRWVQSRQIAFAKSKGAAAWSKTPSFVMMLHNVMDTKAWRSTSHGARSLYVSLKRRWNHNRKNLVWLSVRNAVEELGSSDRQIMRWFAELEHYGFIVKMTPGYLGPDGKGVAPHYRLTEANTNGTDERPIVQATRDFDKWDGTPFDQRRSKAAQDRGRDRVANLKNRTPKTEARPAITRHPVRQLPDTTVRQLPDVSYNHLWGASDEAVQGQRA